MLLYFMRHAEAEDVGEEGDGSRQLTERGVQRTEEAAAALHALDLELDLILSSPAVRAVQTAEIVAAVLEVPLKKERILGVSLGLTELEAALEEHNMQANVLLVGHEPDFSAVIGQLIGGGRVEMKKGAVACVACQGIARGGGTLRWLMNGKLMSMIGEA